jgi:hypothetical protein
VLLLFISQLPCRTMPKVGLARWSIRPIYSTPRLLIGKLGEHLVRT